MDDVKRKFFAGMGKVRETRCFPKLFLIHMMTLPETQQEFQSVKIHVLTLGKAISLSKATENSYQRSQILTKLDSCSLTGCAWVNHGPVARKLHQTGISAQLLHAHTCYRLFFLLLPTMVMTATTL